MTITEAASRLRCSEGAIRILQQKHLLSDPIGEGQIEMFLRSSSLIGQVGKARREDAQNQEHLAQVKERELHKRAELLRRLQRAKESGNYQEATAIHELLIEAETQC